MSVQQLPARRPDYTAQDVRDPVKLAAILNMHADQLYVLMVIAIIIYAAVDKAAH